MEMNNANWAAQLKTRLPKGIIFTGSREVPEIHLSSTGVAGGTGCGPDATSFTATGDLLGRVKTILVLNGPRALASASRTAWISRAKESR